LVDRLTRALRPGGQIAVQVPANADHPSHTVAAEIAREEPFASAFDGEPPPDTVALTVLPPARYAELLNEAGVAEQHVRLQVYGHRLPSTADVVEWTRGTPTLLLRLQANPLLGPPAGVSARKPSGPRDGTQPLITPTG
jgi:trans-aconitate 2-methyltransferase